MGCSPRPHNRAQEIEARQRFDDKATQEPQLYDYLARHRPFLRQVSRSRPNGMTGNIKICRV